MHKLKNFPGVTLKYTVQGKERDCPPTPPMPVRPLTRALQLAVSYRLRGQATVFFI